MSPDVIHVRSRDGPFCRSITHQNLFPNVVIRSDKTSSFKTHSSVLAIWLPKLEPILKEQPDDGDVIVILGGYANETLASLDQFLHTGSIALLGGTLNSAKEESDFLRKEFEDLGVDLPATFWSSPEVRKIERMRFKTEPHFGDEDDEMLQPEVIYNEGDELLFDDFGKPKEEDDDGGIGAVVRTTGGKDGQGHNYRVCPQCAKPIHHNVLDEHIKWHEIGDPDDGNFWACLVCDKLFSLQRMLKFHRSEHKDHRWECPECERVYTGYLPVRWKKHLESHTEGFKRKPKAAAAFKLGGGYGKNYETCELCAKPYHWRTLNEHMHWHKVGQHGDGFCFACIECDKRFESTFRMKQHRAEHKDKVWKCPQCPRTYQGYQPRLIEKHLTWHRNIKDRPFLCDICAKGFKDSHRLKCHKEASHIINKQACKLCNRVMKNDYALHVHMKKYHEKILQCQFCSKRFTCNFDLKEHINVNHVDNSEKPFPCKICGKGFGRSNRLKEHMRIHEDKKQYRCRYCEYQCNNSSNRNKHERQVHNVEKVMDKPVNPVNMLLNSKLFGSS